MICIIITRFRFLGSLSFNLWIDSRTDTLWGPFQRGFFCLKICKLSMLIKSSEKYVYSSMNYIHLQTQHCYRLLAHFKFLVYFLTLCPPPWCPSCLALLNWPFKSPLRLLLLWQVCGFLTMSSLPRLMSLTTHKIHKKGKSGQLRL